MKLILAIAGLLLIIFPGRKEKTVYLDSYFNNETRNDSNGKKQSWHYKWDEKDNDGFSLLGSVFNSYGFATKTSYERPDKSFLNEADIYIIVDPDVPKENPDPKYIEEQDVHIIYDWVKAGGVLVMLANDSGNAELDHFNTLSSKFGIHFDNERRNHVQGNQYETGGINVTNDNIILKKAKKIFMKDICRISITNPAKAVLTDQGDVIIAIAKVGKGTVFAAGDPWLYNEYTDGKKLPVEYQNLEAAKDLVAWLSKQIPKK